MNNHSINMTQRLTDGDSVCSEIELKEAKLSTAAGSTKIKRSIKDSLNLESDSSDDEDAE